MNPQIYTDITAWWDTLPELTKEILPYGLALILTIVGSVFTYLKLWGKKAKTRKLLRKIGPHSISYGDYAVLSIKNPTEEEIILHKIFLGNERARIDCICCRVLLPDESLAENKTVGSGPIRLKPNETGEWIVAPTAWDPNLEPRKFGYTVSTDNEKEQTVIRESLVTGTFYPDLRKEPLSGFQIEFLSKMKGGHWTTLNYFQEGRFSNEFGELILSLANGYNTVARCWNTNGKGETTEGVSIQNETNQTAELKVQGITDTGKIALYTTEEVNKLDHREKRSWLVPVMWYPKIQGKITAVEIELHSTNGDKNYRFSIQRPLGPYPETREAQT